MHTAPPVYPVSPVDLAITAGDLSALLARRKEDDAERPLLLHKRAGIWRIFRWRETVAEVERLTAALHQHGLGEGSRLVLSGTLEPDLLFVALAAHSLGAALYTLDPSLQGAGLERAIHAISPSHAFIRGRRILTRWFATPRPEKHPLLLLTTEPVASHNSSWPIMALWPEPDGGKPLSRRQSRRSILRRHTTGWVDEGTEWGEGLAAVIAAVAQGEKLLVFPETTESATRDRREIRPASLLASPARKERLEAEINHRLPPSGSWRRRLYDRAASGVLANLMRARVNSLFGLPPRQQFLSF